MLSLGIDIGGSGIKGAVVDVDKGVLTTERQRLPTPEFAKPDDVAGEVKLLIENFNWRGPVGCGFPAVIRSGVAWTAANVDVSWIGTDAALLFSQYCKSPVYVLNDADAAGIAEINFGAGKDVKGVVIVVTIGTGLGTAVFVDGKLVPNTELGHIEVRGKDGERRASDATRKRKNLTWQDWAGRLQEYLSTLENLLWPDMMILGGGVSNEPENFMPYLNLRAKIVPAQLRNQAGIIGAAVYASQK